MLGSGLISGLAGLFGPEVRVGRLIHRPRAGFRHIAVREPHFLACLASRIEPQVLLPVRVAHDRLEARRLLDCERDPPALVVDHRAPGIRPILATFGPFEEMRQQHGHAIGQLALFAFAHVLDLVGHMFNVEFVKPAGAQEAGLLLRPDQHVLVVARRCRPHAGRSRLARGNGRGFVDPHRDDFDPSAR